MHEEASPCFFSTLQLVCFACYNYAATFLAVMYIYSVFVCVLYYPKSRCGI